MCFYQDQLGNGPAQNAVKFIQPKFRQMPAHSAIAAYKIGINARIVAALATKVDILSEYPARDVAAPAKFNLA